MYCKFEDFHTISTVVTATVINDTTATCESGTITPNSATTIEITISPFSDRGFCCANTVAYDFVEPIILDSITPQYLMETSSLTNNVSEYEIPQYIHIFGKNFKQSKLLKCKFVDLLNRIEIRQGVFVTSEEIKCQTPFKQHTGTTSVFVANENQYFIGH